MNKTFLDKIGGRKFVLLLLSLLAVVVLACFDKLTGAVGATLTVLFGLYANYNVKQKTELAMTAAEANVTP